MEKINFWKCLKLSLMAIFIFVLASCARKVPIMWVSKDMSQSRVQLFTSLKQPVLTTATGTPACTSTVPIPDATVEKLIAILDQQAKTDTGLGVRVYIAAADKIEDPTSSYGALIKNQIFEIFAPATNIGVNIYKDLGTYYVINNITHNINSISKEDMINYTSVYATNIIRNDSKGFAGTVDNSDENKYNNVLSDTRSICYPYKDFFNFIKKEKDYQNGLTPNELITGIQISLGAFPAGGIGCNRYHYPENKYAKRVMVLFDFTKKDPKSGLDVPYYIDDTPGFDLRDHEGKCGPNNNINNNIVLFSGDNGQLCPTTCPGS